MEKKPRLRAPNFTSADHMLLCEIVEKFKNVIENKKTDGTNLQEKQKAWLEVGQQFNATTMGCSRTVESLQQNYKNLKKRAKKKYSDSKMIISVDREALVQNIEEYGTSSSGWKEVSAHMGASEVQCQTLFDAMKKEAEVKERKIIKDVMGTGGGPPPDHSDDPILDKVKILIGPGIDGLHTIYDGDSTIMDSIHSIPIEATNMDMVPQNDEEPNRKSVIQPIPTENFLNDRANLKRKPHVLLTRKRKLEEQTPKQSSVSDKFKTLAQEKMELVTMQKELLKMQLEEEKEKIKHQQLLRAMELEKMELVTMQKELLKMQLDEEKEKIKHQQLLRAMELNKYKHNELIRKMELERLKENSQI